MEKKYKLMVFALSGVPFIMVLGNSMLIPEFPQIKSALNISQFQVGLLITVFSISAGVSIPLLGYICDRVGRLKVIIPSLLIYGAGGIICGLAALFMKKPYNIILLGRVVQGIGAAGTAPIAMALIGDIFQSKQRTEVLGIIEAANGIGKVTSPILGSALGLISWIVLFFFYAFLAIPIAAGVYFFGEDKIPENNNSLTEYINNVAQIFKKRGFSLIATILAGMIILFTLFGFLAYFSDILETKYEIKGIIKGLVIAIPIIFMSGTSFLNGKLLKKINKYYKMSIIIGLSLITITLILFNFCNNFILYMSLFSILGIGAGLILPAVNTLVTSSTAAKQRGAITSLYGGARFVGVAIGPPVFSYLLEIKEIFMYYGAASSTLLVLILGLIFIKEKGMIPEKNSG